MSLLNNNNNNNILFYSGPDINECTENIDNCTHGCIDTEGSYYCTCPNGYELRKDNTTCVGESISHSFKQAQNDKMNIHCSQTYLLTQINNFFIRYQ